ncbi:uncharacterized protein [Kogia breviceps]|uniref:uncharacterized protein n=1 Tax=Kogia breviceps TaxID=27615 RepID=UPI0034D2030A
MRREQGQQKQLEGCKKWIYLERNTLHRQSVDHLRRGPSLDNSALFSSCHGHPSPLLCGPLSPAEPTDAGVTQTPRHEVTEVGHAVTLSCVPISDHTVLYWYRQTLVQGLEFLIYFRNQAPVDESGMPKDRFSAKMPNASFSTLKIQPTEPGDSAVYLCASSNITGRYAYEGPGTLRTPTSQPRARSLIPVPALPRAPGFSAVWPFVSLSSNATLLLHSVSESSTSSAAHVGAMVIQNPGHLVTRTGKPVTLSCSQNRDHEVMFWYQQKRSQAP